MLNIKKITINSTVIMGRKTWDSLPFKPLPKRKNIVLSKSKKQHVETFQSYEKCMEYLKKNNIKKIFVIGGRSIYKIFYNDADFLHLTKVNLLEPNINEYFPVSFYEINKKFKQIYEKKICPEATYTIWEKQLNI